MKRERGSSALCRSFLVCLAVLVSLGACDLQQGLGPALDLVGPSVSVTSHSNLDFVTGSFPLVGKASDNFEVTKVKVSVQSTLGSSVPGFPREASLTRSSGNEALVWSLQIHTAAVGASMPDGEYIFQIQAFDKAGNSSAGSVAVLALTVDNNGPSTNVNEPRLQENADFYSGLNTEAAPAHQNLAYLEYFQNGIFKIRGNVDENFGLDSLTIHLYGEGRVDPVYTRILSKDTPFSSAQGVEGNLWNWILTIDGRSTGADAAKSMDLDGVTPDAQGRYFLTVRTIAVDRSGIEQDDYQGVFCYFPASDRPWTVVSNVAEGSPVAPSSQVAGNAYDDDGVKDVFLLVQRSTLPAPGSTDFLGWTPQVTSSFSSTRISVADGDPSRLVTWQMILPSDAGQYTLYLYVVDINGVGLTQYKTVGFVVQDQDFPVTRVVSPTDYAEILGTGFDLEGYSFDDSGISSVMLAWVPLGGDPSQLLTPTLWSQYDPTQLQANGSYVLSGSGMKLWDLTSSLSAPYLGSNLPVAGQSRWRRDWSKSFQIVNDLSYGDLNFVVKTVDETGNTSYTRLAYLGDRSAPSVAVTVPGSNGVYLASRPSQPYRMHGTWNDNSGRIDRIEARWIEGPDVPASTSTAVISGSQWYLDLPFDFEDGANNLEISAIDESGNRGYALRYMIITNNVPQVLRVSSADPNGSYRSGAEILLQVEFNQPVYVTGTPQLLLGFENSVTAAAPYVGSGGGSGTPLLTFRYTVAPGQNTTRLNYSSLNSLLLGGGAIKDAAGSDAAVDLPGLETAGSLKTNKNFRIDTSPPTVVNVTSTTPDGPYKAGSSLNLQIQFNEAVVVDGPSSLRMGTHPESERWALYALGSGTPTLTYVFTVEEGDNALDLDYHSIGALLGAISDFAENEAPRTLPSLGGEGSLAHNQNLVVDTTSPGAPSFNAQPVSGSVHNTDQVLTVSGEEGAQLFYSLNAGSSWLQPSPAVTSGSFTISAEGTYTVLIKQRDTAGNESLAASSHPFTIDKTAPGAPVILGLVNGTYATDRSFSIAGESAASFQYTLSWNTSDGASSWIDYSGSPVTLSEQGSYTVRARQVDGAGNVGPSGSSYVLIIDKSAPTVTLVTSSTPDAAYNLNKVISVDVSFSKAVYVTGAPRILLETGAIDRYASYATGSGTTTLNFVYVVQTGDTSPDLNYFSASSLEPNGGGISDVLGNVGLLTLPSLSSAQSLGGNKALVVDTTAPAAPTLVGVTAGSQNSDQAFTLGGIEAGASAQYSLNGGTNWVAYSSQVTLSEEMAYNITARQTDAAGNVSPQGGAVALTIDKTLPVAPFISGITAGDRGTAQSFQVFGEAGSFLEYSLNGGSSWTSYGTAVSLNPGAGNEAVYNVLARQTDAAGNGPVTTPSPITLRVDLRAPTINSYSPAQNSLNIGVADSLVLTFSEAVWKESGNLTIKRLYNRFPVVMTVDERNEYRSRMTAAQQNTLDTSYTLTTNGAPSGVPNTTGVYVLNYSLEPDNGVLLSLFDAMGYNQIVIPVDSSQVSGNGTNTITINPSSDLPVGIHWYLLVDATAFRDVVGNPFGGISSSATYRFSTGPVATPIVRIFKQSGSGTTQPAQTTFKISSETQGAVIRYTNSNSTPTAWDPTLPAAPADPVGGSPSYTSAVTIGTTATNAGYIYRLKARAYLTSFTDSSVAEEVAFKTVLSTNYNAGGGRYIWYRGSNNSGGPTTAPGFPLRWEDNQYAYIKCAAVDTTPEPDRWYWITWEISVANVGTTPVPAEFKALWCDQPGDWQTMGPSVYSWESGANKRVYAGGYNNSTPGSFEGWAAHSRP